MAIARDVRRRRARYADLTLAFFVLIVLAWWGTGLALLVFYVSA